MSTGGLAPLLVGALTGLLSSTAFVLALFVGFCVLVGLTKLKRTSGDAAVVKSLDEAVSREPARFLPPTTPRGVADQLRAPELLESAARQ